MRLRVISLKSNLRHYKDIRVYLHSEFTAVAEKRKMNLAQIRSSFFIGREGIHRAYSPFVSLSQPCFFISGRLQYYLGR